MGFFIVGSLLLDPAFAVLRLFIALAAIATAAVRGASLPRLPGHALFWILAGLPLLLVALILARDVAMVSIATFDTIFYLRPREFSPAKHTPFVELLESRERWIDYYSDWHKHQDVRNRLGAARATDDDDVRAIFWTMVRVADRVEQSYSFPRRILARLGMLLQEGSVQEESNLLDDLAAAFGRISEPRFRAVLGELLELEHRSRPLGKVWALGDWIWMDVQDKPQVRTYFYSGNCLYGFHTFRMAALIAANGRARNHGVRALLGDIVSEGGSWKTAAEDAIRSIGAPADLVDFATKILGTAPATQPVDGMTQTDYLLKEAESPARSSMDRDKLLRALPQCRDRATAIDYLDRLDALLARVGPPKAGIILKAEPPAVHELAAKFASFLGASDPTTSRLDHALWVTVQIDETHDLDLFFRLLTHPHHAVVRAMLYKCQWWESGMTRVLAVAYRTLRSSGAGTEEWHQYVRSEDRFHEMHRFLRQRLSEESDAGEKKEISRLLNDWGDPWDRAIPGAAPNLLEGSLGVAVERLGTSPLSNDGAGRGLWDHLYGLERDGWDLGRSFVAPLRRCLAFHPLLTAQLISTNHFHELEMDLQHVPPVDLSGTWEHQYEKSRLTLESPWAHHTCARHRPPFPEAVVSRVQTGLKSGDWIRANYLPLTRRRIWDPRLTPAVVESLHAVPDPWSRIRVVRIVAYQHLHSCTNELEAIRREAKMVPPLSWEIDAALESLRRCVAKGPCPHSSGDSPMETGPPFAVGEE